jgi:hypothetical protein
MRQCGGDVRELMHDGCPTACVDDAAFGSPRRLGRRRRDYSATRRGERSRFRRQRHR